MLSSSPWPKNTAQETVDPDPVVDELRPAILTFRGAQRPHPPDVRIGVDAVQCTVEKNREALLLLLCAYKVRLAASLLRRTTNNHPDPFDCHAAKQEREPICDSLER